MFGCYTNIMNTKPTSAPRSITRMIMPAGFSAGVLFVPSNPPIAQVKVQYRAFSDGKIVAEDLTHPMARYQIWNSRADFDADCAEITHIDPENYPRPFPKKAIPLVTVRYAVTTTRSNWCVVAVLRPADRLEDYESEKEGGTLAHFRTKREAKEFRDSKNEDVRAEGNYRASL